MRRGLGFCWESFVRGLGWLLLSVGDNVGRALTIVAVVIGGGLAFYFLDSPPWGIAAGLYCFIFAAVVRGAYEQWDSADKALAPYREKRPLQVALDSDDSLPGQLWWNLRVTNPSRQPLQGCYARIMDYRRVSATGWRDHHRLPLPGTRLLWRVTGGDEARQTTPLGGESRDWCSLGAAVMNDNTMYLAQAARKRTGGNLPMVQLPMEMAFPLPEGVYEVDIELGSETEPLEIARLSVRLVYKGGLRLTAEAL